MINLSLSSSGLSQLKEFHASSLRIRQAWHGNKWMVIGKVAQCEDLNNNLTPKFPYCAGGLLFRTSLHLCKTPQFREKDRGGMHKGRADNAAVCMPMRAISKGYDRQSEDCNMEQLFGGTLRKRKIHPLFNRLDDISLPHVRVDGKFIKQSANRNNRMENTTTPHCLYDSSRPVWSTEDSDQCSVTSCSFNGVSNYAGEISRKSLESTPDHSDAESSFPYSCGKRDFPLFLVDTVGDIHELELRAYKSTVEALYASGPLIWDQESLLTNLRLFLNISDEDHLLQLRQLLSAQAATYDLNLRSV